MGNYIFYVPLFIIFGVLVFLVYLALSKHAPEPEYFTDSKHDREWNPLLEARRKRMAAYDTSNINVKSFGRKVGSFGEYGLTVTNPVCLTNLEEGLRSYISNLCYDGNGVEKYRITAVYRVSLFSTSVQKVELLIRNTHEVIPMFFSESTYENRDEFPSGFSSYSQHLQNELRRKASTGSEEDSGIKLSLRDSSSSISFSLRLTEKEEQRQYLVWRERNNQKQYTIKTIWEM